MIMKLNKIIGGGVMEILISLIFLIGVLTVGKFVLNLSTNILLWVTIGMLVYMGLQYFNLI
jgi:hypothetical protein